MLSGEYPSPWKKILCVNIGHSNVELGGQIVLAIMHIQAQLVLPRKTAPNCTRVSSDTDSDRRNEHNIESGMGQMQTQVPMCPNGYYLATDNLCYPQQQQQQQQ